MPSLQNRITRLEHGRSARQTFVWRPSDEAGAVQIGRHITKRRDGETAEEMLDRAIREYPDKRVKLVVVGWRQDDYFL